MADYVLDKGYIADSAVTRWRFVKFSSDDQSITAVTATTDAVVGVAQETVASGSADIGRRAIDIRQMGVSVCEAGGTITRGQNVEITATGTVIAAAGAGSPIVGRALQSAVSGDWFNVQLELGHVPA